MELERHQSPDGILSLVVARKADDLIVGFASGLWHTHGDVLIGEYACIGEHLEGPEAAVRRYVSDILNDRIKVIVSRVAGAILDVWAVPYEVSHVDRYLEPGETIEVRTWNHRTGRSS